MNDKTTFTTKLTDIAAKVVIHLLLNEHYKISLLASSINIRLEDLDSAVHSTI